MIGEIVGEAVGGVLRFVGQVLFEGVFEILVRGVGYLICRPFKHNIDPESFLVALVGMLFWICVAGVGYLIYTHIGAARLALSGNSPVSQAGD